jgi:NAD(P)-dependent dehydrogenase (short-subunit alcohol dehydrogenase family)
MLDEVRRQCDGALDGLVAGAGVINVDDGLIVSVNYFGATATLLGLRPLLAGSDNASAVAIGSNSSTAQPGVAPEVADACLADVEGAAVAVAQAHPGSGYAGSKLALARWVRRHAPTADWAGAGIRLNVIAPGLVATPMTAGTEDFIMGLGDIFPMPMQRAGRADEVAGLLAYLLSPAAAFFCGSFIVMDGGTEAAARPDAWPTPRP